MTDWSASISRMNWCTKTARLQRLLIRVDGVRDKRQHWWLEHHSLNTVVVEIMSHVCSMTCGASELFDNSRVSSTLSAVGLIAVFMRLRNLLACLLTYLFCFIEWFSNWRATDPPLLQKTVSELWWFNHHTAYRFHVTNSVHNCRTQYNTEQLWLFFLLTSRQSSHLCTLFVTWNLYADW